MKVKDLTVRLQKYNPEAEMNVIAHNKKYPFSLCFGGGDGGTIETADFVGFCVDSLCSAEKEGS